MNAETISGLIREIEAKDLSTAAHTWRVTLYTRAMAEAAGSSHEAVDALTQAAALHDIGKLDIPDAVLQKPGRLTPEEFEIIKQHPVTGYARMIQLDVEDEIVLDLIRYHHERWDGQGYPYGIAGEEIPMSARYFAVIDAFDAMTSVRPYRTEIGDAAAERALVELKAGMGTRYWPDAVEMFDELFRDSKFDYILHYFNDDVPVPDFAAARDEQFATIRKDFGDS